MMDSLEMLRKYLDKDDKLDRGSLDVLVGDVEDDFKRLNGQLRTTESLLRRIRLRINLYFNEAAQDEQEQAF